MTVNYITTSAHWANQFHQLVFSRKFAFFVILREQTNCNFISQWSTTRQCLHRVRREAKQTKTMRICWQRHRREAARNNQGRPWKGYPDSGARNNSGSPNFSNSQILWYMLFKCYL